MPGIHMPPGPRSRNADGYQSENVLCAGCLRRLRAGRRHRRRRTTVVGRRRAGRGGSAPRCSPRRRGTSASTSARFCPTSAAQPESRRRVGERHAARRRFLRDRTVTPHASAETTFAIVPAKLPGIAVPRSCRPSPGRHLRPADERRAASLNPSPHGHHRRIDNALQDRVVQAASSRTDSRDNSPRPHAEASTCTGEWHQPGTGA